MAAEESLGGRGRSNVRLTLTGPEGTSWIEVSRQAPERDKRPGQLRLF